MWFKQFTPMPFYHEDGQSYMLNDIYYIIKDN